MAYPNLLAEMRRFNVNQDEIAESIGRTPETVSRWMNGKSQMGVDDAFKIKAKFFPTMSVDYLFASEPIINRVS